MAEHKTLDEYFTALRAAGAISEESVRTIVGTAIPEKRLAGMNRRPIVATGIIVSLIAVVYMIYFLQKGDTVSETVSGAASYSVESIAHDRLLSTSGEEGVMVAKSEQPIRQRNTDTIPVSTRKHILPVKREEESSHNLRVVPVGIDGVRMIELTRDELAQVGVELGNDGRIRCYSKGYTISSQYPDSLYLSMSAVQIENGQINTYSVAEKDMPSGIIPVGTPKLITDIHGFRRLIRWWSEPDERADSTSRFIDSIHSLRFTRSYSVENLIPIRIRGMQRGGSASQEDIILWYDATPSLLEHFPPCIRDALRAEFAGLMEHRQSDHSSQFRDRLSERRRHIYDSLRALDVQASEQPCSDADGNAIVGKPYLDVWRSTSGAIVATSISPNPSHDVARLRYQLNAPRTLSVRLNDLQGRQVRVLVASETNSEGTWQLELNMHDVAPGVYLVVLTTNTGEYAVQRLAVE